MHHFTYKSGRLYCEDVPLDDIAETYGTPTYVYSTATLVRHISVLKEAFADTHYLIAYSVKANGNLGVLSTLAAEGAGADLVCDARSGLDASSRQFTLRTITFPTE